MRLSGSTHASAGLLSSLLFSALVAATGNIDCSNIVADGVMWDLSKLGGPRSVMESHTTDPVMRNTTYTIDICKPLVPAASAKKGDRCRGGTRVCGIEHTIKPEDGTDEITKVIPIAGDLRDHGGKDLNAKFTRLKTEDSTKDAEREGVRIELNGGSYADPKAKDQKAIVEFICNPDRTGLETDLEPEGNYQKSKGKRAELGVSSLVLIEYDTSQSDVDVLKLEWNTKYACESSNGDDDGVKKGRWGFFTWFLIIAFLAIASYLIFGSWLNYNRYGARGWDLLPHGDTIRDVPYLLKDWTRKVLNTVQGSGSRGGYSAV